MNILATREKTGGVGIGPPFPGRLDSKVFRRQTKYSTTIAIRIRLFNVYL